MLTNQQATEIVLTHFPDIKGELSFTRLCGLTNVTYSVNINGHPAFILKSFSDGFDREAENQIVRQLGDYQLAARVFFANKTYRIEEFIQSAVHPSNDDLKNAALVQKILIHLYRFHSAQISVGKDNIIPTDYLWTDPQVKKMVKSENFQTVASYQNLKAKILLILDNQLAWRRKLMPEDKSSVRFCHNDLNNLNILMVGDKLHFIDYDYVAYNYLAYDIANFLNEACINYTVTTNPGFSLERHFTFDEISQICRGYPGYYEGLALEVLKFFCVANLYWAVWSLKRYNMNKTSTFDILEHGLTRMELFDYYNQIVNTEILRISSK